MKTSRFFSFLALAALVTISSGLLQSCESESGEPGPQGEQGPKGDKGDKGDAGATGATGAIGTANVIYGNWIKMDVAGYWYKESNLNRSSNSWGGNFAAPITQAILDRGQVAIYGRYPANRKYFCSPM